MRKNDEIVTGEWLFDEERFLFDEEGRLADIVFYKYVEKPNVVESIYEVKGKKKKLLWRKK